MLTVYSTLMTSLVYVDFPVQMQRETEPCNCVDWPFFVFII